MSLNDPHTNFKKVVCQKKPRLNATMNYLYAGGDDETLKFIEGVLKVFSSIFNLMIFFQSFFFLLLNTLFFLWASEVFLCWSKISFRIMMMDFVVFFERTTISQHEIPWHCWLRNFSSFVFYLRTVYFHLCMYACMYNLLKVDEVRKIANCIYKIYNWQIFSRIGKQWKIYRELQMVLRIPVRLAIFWCLHVWWL